MHTIALLALLSATQLPAGPAADRILIVTLDGLRWQELFGGAQPELISKPAGGVADTASTLQRYWRETAEARREALMPFLWGVVAGRGRILGDSAGGSIVRVSNGKRFSYAGPPTTGSTATTRFPTPT
jgi:hypothetical protein